MAVAQPDILLVLNDSSGTTVTNDGSVATDASVGQGVENTDWDWNSGAGSYDGFWGSLDAAGDDQAWIDMTGISLSSTLTHYWAAIAINITGYDTRGSSQGWLVGRASASDDPGGITFLIDDPSGAGDFNLRCRFEVTAGLGAEHVYADLSFSTDYQIVAAIDLTTSSAAQAKFLLDGGTIQKPSTVNLTATNWDSNGGYIGRAGGFSNFYGFIGDVYYFAQDRGTLLSDTDMSDINTDPAGTIGGWPSAGAANPKGVLGGLALGGPFGGPLG